MEKMLLANRGCSTEMPNKSWCRSSEEGNSDFGTATKLFDRVRAGRFADVVNTGGAERGLKNLSRALDSAKALIDRAVGESVQGVQLRNDTGDGGHESAAKGKERSDSMQGKQGDPKARQFLESLVVAGYVANAAYNLFGCLDESQENVPRGHQGQDRDNHRNVKSIGNVQNSIYSRGMQCDKHDLIKNNSILNSVNTNSLRRASDVAMHGDSPPASPSNAPQKPISGLFDALQRSHAEHEATELDMMHDADSEGGDSCAASDDDYYEDNASADDLDTAVQPVIRRVPEDVVVKMEDDVVGDDLKRVNRRADVRNNMRGNNVGEHVRGASSDRGVATAAVRPFGHPSLEAKKPIIAGISRTPEIIDGALSIMGMMRRGANGATKVDNGNEADQLNVAALALQDLANMAQRSNTAAVVGTDAVLNRTTWQKKANGNPRVGSVVDNTVVTSQETINPLSFHALRQESAHGNSDQESETENEDPDHVVNSDSDQGVASAAKPRRSHAAAPVAARKSILKKGDKKKLKRGKRKLLAGGNLLLQGGSPAKKRAGARACGERGVLPAPNGNGNGNPLLAANLNAPLPAKKCSKRVHFSPEVLKKAAYAEKKHYEKSMKAVLPKEKSVVEKQEPVARSQTAAASCGDDIFMNAASRALVFKAIAAVMRG